MKRGRQRGIAYVEFALSLLVLVPLLLGTGVTGVNMIRSLQVVQLARDAGHMYARNVDFCQPGNQTMLATLGNSVGITSPTAGTAVVILSKLTYVDDAACAAGGAATDGVHNGNCTNFQKWVFQQRLYIGNSGVRNSNYGTPSGVTIASDGSIAATDYVKKTGAVATISGVNPYSVANRWAQGLPSGQSLYLSEAASTGFSLPPYVANAAAYSSGFF